MTQADELQKLPEGHTMDTAENRAEQESMLNQSEEQLIEQIKAEEIKVKGQPKEALPQPEQVMKTAEQVEEEEVVKEVEEVEEEPSKEQDSPKTEEVVEKEVVESSLDKLKEKKGLKNPEAIADMYLNLEKDYHKKSQELATLKKAGEVKPEAPQMTEDIKDQFIEAFNKDPLTTMANFYDAYSKPQQAKQQRTDVRNEIARLSSSPDTADFSKPEIQEQMQKLYNENPERYFDANQRVKPSEIETAYYIAKGKMSSTPGSSKTVRKTVTKGNKPVPVEGKQKAQQQETVKPEDMSTDDLKKLIENYPGA